MFTKDGQFIPNDQPRFDQLSGEQQIATAAYWALADMVGPKELTRATRDDHQGSPIHYTQALFDVAKLVGKYPRSPFDRGRIGTGLPRQRKVRAS
jgi:hypothetical protein